MFKYGISHEDIAEKLGYNVGEIRRIIDSRLFINLAEIKAFAQCLNVSVEKLTTPITEEKLIECGYMECRGHFSNVESREIIFNLFDTYCDISESVQSERKVIRNGL
jgi:transcriptional regulator with XRE-family HTH domain